jgi:hypothetical protein
MVVSRRLLLLLIVSSQPEKLQKQRYYAYYNSSYACTTYSYADGQHYDYTDKRVTLYKATIVQKLELKRQSE